MLKAVLRLVLHPGADMEAIARYMTCMDGRDRFLRGEISFEDYLDILEWAGVEIDNFLDVLEDNLIVVGA